MLGGPPAFPSQPPPARDDDIRPMSAVAALLWVTCATFAFLFVGTLLVSAREDAARDQTVLIGCQTAAYLLTLFAILRVHGPDSTIREFVGLRATHAAFYPLAAIAGGASAFWGSWLLDRIHRRFPDPDNANRLIELFFEATPAGRVAMGVGIVLVGPLVEELIFRGAVFNPMTRRHPTEAVILWTSALFAVVHVEPRVLAPPRGLQRRAVRRPLHPRRASAAERATGGHAGMASWGGRRGLRARDAARALAGEEERARTRGSSARSRRALTRRRRAP